MSFAIHGFSIPDLALPVAAATPATSAGSGGASPDHRKLVDAAQQFEGMLLQEMLKPMKEHGFCQKEGEDGDEGDSSGGGDTLSSYGTETMATAIAKAGGLGIARRVVEQVEGERELHNTIPTPGGSNKNLVTVLKS